MGKCYLCPNIATEDKNSINYHAWYLDTEPEFIKPICPTCYQNYTVDALNYLFLLEKTEEKVQELNDKVNSPNHYTWIPGIECSQVTGHFNFNKGNVIKYIWRAGFKEGNTELEDLQKAKKYIEMEIERLSR